MHTGSNGRLVSKAVGEKAYMDKKGTKPTVAAANLSPEDKAKRAVVAALKCIVALEDEALIVSLMSEFSIGASARLGELSK